MRTPDGWARDACAATSRAIGGASSWRSFSGLWSTGQAQYAEVSLPPGFRLRVADVCGARRRIAECDGKPPTLVIVPGLFASLHERLFVDIAAEAQERGRAVLLIEDRFAATTLMLNTPDVPTAAALAKELSAIVGGEDEPPDVLALSAGALSALFLDAPVRRMVLWSAAYRPAAVLAHAQQSLFIRRHFDAIRRRAYMTGSRPAPSWEELVELLSFDETRGISAAPLLLVHANDDPVAPVADIDRMRTSLRADQAACIVRHGGHLGFGALWGSGIYLLPFSVDVVDSSGPAESSSPTPAR